MSGGTHTQLRGLTDVWGQQLTDAIGENVREFFQWGVLNAGGFVNVPVRTPGTNDPDADELFHPVSTHGIADNKIWESTQGGWVYETGVDPLPAPVTPSGVYINGSFKATNTTTGTYAHHFDFREGRVVFDAPIPATSIVQAEYSYRWLNIYDQNQPWFRDVVMDAYLSDVPPGSGFVDLLNNNRVRLPALIVEPVMNRKQRGVMLGSGAHWISQDVLFHILAERESDRNALMDIVTWQQDKTFYLYDVNARRQANEFPLDWRGSPRPGAKMYPDLVEAAPSGYRWKKACFSGMSGVDVSLRLPLYRGIVRATVEVDFLRM